MRYLDNSTLWTVLSDLRGHVALDDALRRKITILLCYIQWKQGRDSENCTADSLYKRAEESVIRTLGIKSLDDIFHKEVFENESCATLAIETELNAESNKLNDIVAEDTLVHRDKDMERFEKEMHEEGADVVDVEPYDEDELDEIDELDDFEYIDE